MEGGDTVEDGVARGIDDFDVFDGFGCTLVSTVLEFPLARQAGFGPLDKRFDGLGLVASGLER